LESLPGLWVLKTWINFIKLTPMQNYITTIPQSLSTPELIKLKSIYEQSPDVHKRELEAIEKALREKQPHKVIEDIS
jgi:hypothetical protein